MVTSQTQCPRCTGQAGAHFAFCFLAQAWERFMGDAYPWRAPVWQPTAEPIAEPVNLTDGQARLDVLASAAPVTQLPPGYYDSKLPRQPVTTGSQIMEAIRRTQAEGDSFEEWRQERTVAVGERDSTFLRDLYADYAHWCRPRGILPLPSEGTNGFGQRMAKLGYRRGRPIDKRTGAQITGYFGIALKSALLAEQEAPAPEQAPEPEQQTEAIVTPEPSAAPAPAPAPAPEPEPQRGGRVAVDWDREQRMREAAWVQRVLNANGLTRAKMSAAIGRSAAEVSNAMNAKRYAPGVFYDIMMYARSLPVQPVDEAPTPEAPTPPPPPTGQGMPPQTAQEEILGWLAEHTDSAPDDHWTAMSVLVEEYLKTHPEMNSMVAGRYIGLVLTNLGHRKLRTTGGAVEGVPANGEDPAVPRGRSVYYGLKLKSSQPTDEVPDEVPDWMVRPTPKERDKRDYTGDMPGREINQDYRERIVLPLIDQGWTYFKHNSNGAGKPRIVNPQGKTYALANTPSDWRGVKNAISYLRKLGAEL